MPQSSSRQRTKRVIIPTPVYAALFLLLVITNSIWACAAAHAQKPDNAAYAIGMVVGGVLFPLGVITGIACIWKVNRSLHGILRALFWGSLFGFLTKLASHAH